ncbi:ferredoxin [Rhodococcus sp. MSC1_016]|jgi:ferredoxin|uniref:ferredoxin n=1 Tax=Rhodococcus sp. MSC1_016 TaxID=2909266 RepID=UPI00202EC02A|nr:ferredoxin [Rhodococcus sp. MSC1_016]
MKIGIDESACIGAGLCVLEAEDVFDQRDNDGVAIVLAPDPAPDRFPAVRKAAAVCPVMAISVDED